VCFIRNQRYQGEGTLQEGCGVLRFGGCCWQQEWCRHQNVSEYDVRQEKRYFRHKMLVLGANDLSPLPTFLEDFEEYVCQESDKASGAIRNRDATLLALLMMDEQRVYILPFYTAAQ
jgi:hypothetical protein